MEKIEITPENAEERVNRAAETLFACWPDWDMAAQESAQAAQDGDAYDLEMLNYIAVVLEGMVFDPPLPSDEA